MGRDDFARAAPGGETVDYHEPGLGEGGFVFGHAEGVVSSCEGLGGRVKGSCLGGCFGGVGVGRCGSGAIEGGWEGDVVDTRLRGRGKKM